MHRFSVKIPNSHNLIHETSRSPHFTPYHEAAFLPKDPYLDNMRLVRFQSTAQALGIKRKPFASISSTDMGFFAEKIGASNVITEDLEGYNNDWVSQYKGQSKLLLRPNSTEQVSEIMRHCYTNNLAVVPVGGRSGLVGGTLSLHDEILLSLERLNTIRSFDPISGTLVADAGVVLETADKYLEQQSHIFPLDLGAKGSAMLGGVVSTNAGGVRLLRYGSLHGSVMGIEAVLPNGDVFNGLSTVRKDNTGFDLKQLFIGSEGMLGVVTGVSIQCPPLPSAINVSFFGLESYEKVQQLFALAKVELGEILGSFECIDQVSLGMVRLGRTLVEPLHERLPYTVLVETRGSNQEHDHEKLEKFVERAMNEEIIADGTVAHSQQEQNNLWAWRETIPIVCGELGGFYSYDVSIPLPVMYDLIADVDAQLRAHNLVGDNEDFPIRATCGFGHIGDGNLHVIIPCRYYDDRVNAALEPFIFEWVQKYQGSVSAEHGVGFQKRNHKKYSRDATQIGLMKMLKLQFDPKGILNPYKFFGDEDKAWVNGGER